ncbi:endonuclease/exonuclease/phosphatase family protein [Ulvibacterium marinum]|uniref:Endonuclease/exonuclease/phosphatase family protein n=1 Tax=Ulvibacterium marinum TaxID=2419782 RepID=A0A3B0CDT0_9FLAO|nr:endonuclease/exonuclease/phosphatase family protein [Ulvibacterium marinum]RKN83091.1 endonuclease/exonuclease/phosphatase family protein [Ulvibacterium marinum]
MKFSVLFPCLIIAIFGFSQQSKKYMVRTIAFYNVENLFDTKNDSLIFDDDRTPNGKDRWTTERYRKKLRNISKVMAKIGADVTKTSPDLIGLCEVENKQVLQDLIHQPALLEKGYGIVHFDSPDERGIDVALLYKKSVFIPSSFESHRLLLFNTDDERNYTRDQLVVGGLLDNEKIHFIINHWPSRSGGESRSKPNRIAAAQLNKHIMDSLIRLDANSKIISMGDLNDDPIDESLKKILKTKGVLKKLETGELFNPMEKMYKKGIGSLAYRDKWNLFDQIFFTSNLVNSNEATYQFWRAGVFSPSYLITQKGPYKGYPFRTYAGGNYTGGYSDHFPVYLYLIKATSDTFNGEEP